MKIPLLWWGIALSIIIPLVFLSQFVINSSQVLGPDATDAYHQNFILKHYMTVFLSGNFSDILTLPMMYGIKNSLLFTDHLLSQALMALPIYLVTSNIVLAYNLLIVISIMLSSAFMYLLAWHFTKNLAASIIAAIIFSLNPLVFTFFPTLNLISVQWIPAIFLFFEKSLISTTNRNVFLLFFFIILQLLSNLYYFAFLTVIFPIYVLLRLKQTKYSPVKLLNKGAISGAIILVTIAIFDFYLYSKSVSKNAQAIAIDRDLESISLGYSPWLSDWILAPSKNVVYGPLREKLSQKSPNLFSSGNNEQNLFWGLSPILLFFTGFLFVKNPAVRQKLLLFYGMLFLCFLLAFGPFIHISKDIVLPGPYRLLYETNPLFTYMRVPSRFAVILFLFLGLISAITFSQIIRRLKPAYVFAISLLTIAFLLTEYLNRPQQFIKIPDSTRQFYNVLNSQNQIDVVVDLPIGNRIPTWFPEGRPNGLDANYLMPATVLHNKKIFGGYSSYVPDEYYAKANLISLDFPSNQKLTLLKSWGVDAIILHKDEFNDPNEYPRIRKALSTQKVPEVTKTDNLSLFDLTEWNSN